MLKALRLRKLLILLFIFPIPWDSSANTLLECLGREELTIHKSKLGGPLYELNQNLINQVINISMIPIRKGPLKRICNAPMHNVSLALLKEALFSQDRLYIRPSEEEFMHKKYLDYFYNQVPGIFVTFLTSLQKLAPTAKCIQSNLEEVPILLRKLQVLSEHMGMPAILKEKNYAKVILNKLTKIDSIIETCEKKLKKEKAKLKKVLEEDQKEFN